VTRRAPPDRAFTILQPIPPYLPSAESESIAGGIAKSIAKSIAEGIAEGLSGIISEIISEIISGSTRR